MGANVSKSSQKILMDASTNIITQVLTKFSTTQMNNVNASQIINVIVSGGQLSCGGNLNLSQKNNVIFSALMNASSQDKKDMSNEISKQLDAKISSLISQENSGINFGQANVNWSDSDIQQKVSTAINTAFSTTIENTLKNDVANKQVINFYVDKNVTVAGNCDFNQEATTTMLAQMITQNIAESLITNVDKNLLTADSQLQVTQTNAGLNWPWIGGGIFGVIGFCIFAFIIFKVMKKKKGGD